MIEKVGTIKNPLTIIAIFAAIAEISGTVVLPFINEANQSTYIWFLIVFPILLIILFFLTLNFNHKVLYAPSGYQNEENFLHSLPRATATEKLLKIEAELKDVEQSPSAPTENTPVLPPTGTVSAEKTPSPILLFEHSSRASSQAMYLLTEELVFKKLGREFAGQIQREVKLGPIGSQVIFDGMVQDKGITTGIEVYVARDPINIAKRAKEASLRIEDWAKLATQYHLKNFRVILAIASANPELNQEKIESIFKPRFAAAPFPVELRFYKLGDLERVMNFLPRPRTIRPWAA